MGKKLSDDVLKFIVEIDGKPAQLGLNLVEQETRRLERSNKSLATEMAKLEANGKKGTAEWKAYEAQIKANNISISELKKKQGDLRKEVGISNLTVKQLRQEYRRLKQAQDGADPNSKEWKQYETQLKAIKGRLNELNGAQRRTNGLFGSLKTLMPAMGLAAGVALFSRLKDKIFDTRAEFQKYEAVLTTTFGSQKKAQKEMDMLVDFASKTPFQLNELTNSFVKLTNYGMQPTRKEMESMGDTAASVGKSFDQFAEAIADAATGENERLKEFGIRAAKNGDKIAYTFKGITTEVDNNTESIKKYLFSLGDMEGVAGSMAAISKTMGGQASNMADNFDRLWNNLGKGAAGGVITGAIQGINSLLDVVNDWMEVPIAQKILEEKIQVNGLVSQLTDANTKEEERVKILNKLKEINPDIVEGIDAQNISIDTLRTNLDKYNESITKRILLETLNKEEQEKAAILAKAQLSKANLIADQNNIIAKTNTDVALSEETLEEKTRKTLKILKEKENAMRNTLQRQIAVAYAGANANPQELTDLINLQTQLKTGLEGIKGYTEEENSLLEQQTNLSARLIELKKILGINESTSTIKPKGGKPTTTTTSDEAYDPIAEEEEKWANYDPTTDPYIQMLDKQDAAEKAIRDQKSADRKAWETTEADARLQENLEKIKANKEIEEEITRKAKEESDKRLAQMQKNAELYQSIQTFANKAVEDFIAGNEDALKEGAKSILILLLDVLKAQTEMAIAGATIQSLAQPDSIATLGASGFIRAAIIISLIEAAFAGVKGIVGRSFSSKKSTPTAKQYYDGNVMDVIGAQTGRKYKASLSNGKSGIYNKPTFLPGLRGIAGERDPELVLSGAHTRNIQNNYPELLDAIAHTMPEYAAGNVSSTNTERTYEKTFTDPLLLTLLQKLDQRLNEPIRTELVANENYLRTHNKKQAEYEAFRNRIG